MRRELKEIINQAGATVLLVTHDTKDALSTADRIAIMKSGRIQQIGNPEKLYSQPHNAYVAGFFGKINLIEGSTDSEGCRRILALSKTPTSHQGPIQILIRPQDLELVESSDGILDGEIRMVDYFGDHFEVYVQFDKYLNIPDLVVWTRKSFQIGDRVFVTCRSQNVQVLGIK